MSAAADELDHMFAAITRKAGWNTQRQATASTKQ